eukprot:TRINITY_DN364_c0_g1_i18.p1 TRINITY_DN364_c0_g1~~TRINITY_DN364_c0_g1_i18.p1  ORF type:complete len:1494 (-),score=322.52 TRINITY_DN364_c0_g1_i18:222-4703(-)
MHRHTAPPRPNVPRAAWVQQRPEGPYFEPQGRQISQRNQPQYRPQYPPEYQQYQQYQQQQQQAQQQRQHSRGTIRSAPIVRAQPIASMQQRPTSSAAPPRDDASVTTSLYEAYYQDAAKRYLQTQPSNLQPQRVPIQPQRIEPQTVDAHPSFAPHRGHNHSHNNHNHNHNHGQPQRQYVRYPPTQRRSFSARDGSSGVYRTRDTELYADLHGDDGVYSSTRDGQLYESAAYYDPRYTSNRQTQPQPQPQPRYRQYFQTHPDYEEQDQVSEIPSSRAYVEDPDEYYEDAQESDYGYQHYADQYLENGASLGGMRPSVNQPKQLAVNPSYNSQSRTRPVQYGVREQSRQYPDSYYDGYSESQDFDLYEEEGYHQYPGDQRNVYQESYSESQQPSVEYLRPSEDDDMSAYEQQLWSRAHNDQQRLYSKPLGSYLDAPQYVRQPRDSSHQGTSFQVRQQHPQRAGGYRSGGLEHPRSQPSSTAQSMDYGRPHSTLPSRNVATFKQTVQPTKQGASAQLPQKQPSRADSRVYDFTPSRPITERIPHPSQRYYHGSESEQTFSQVNESSSLPTESVGQADSSSQIATELERLQRTWDELEIVQGNLEKLRKNLERTYSQKKQSPVKASRQPIQARGYSEPSVDDYSESEPPQEPTLQAEIKAQLGRVKSIQDRLTRLQQLFDNYDEQSDQLSKTESQSDADSQYNQRQKFSAIQRPQSASSHRDSELYYEDYEESQISQDQSITDKSSDMHDDSTELTDYERAQRDLEDMRLALCYSRSLPVDKREAFFREYNQYFQRTHGFDDESIASFVNSHFSEDKQSRTEETESRTESQTQSQTESQTDYTQESEQGSDYGEELDEACLLMPNVEEMEQVLVRNKSNPQFLSAAISAIRQLENGDLRKYAERHLMALNPNYRPQTISQTQGSDSTPSRPTMTSHPTKHSIISYRSPKVSAQAPGSESLGYGLHAVDDESEGQDSESNYADSVTESQDSYQESQEYEDDDDDDDDEEDDEDEAGDDSETMDSDYDEEYKDDTEASITQEQTEEEDYDEYDDASNDTHSRDEYVDDDAVVVDSDNGMADADEEAGYDKEDSNEGEEDGYDSDEGPPCIEEPDPSPIPDTNGSEHSDERLRKHYSRVFSTSPTHTPFTVIRQEPIFLSRGPEDQPDKVVYDYAESAESVGAVSNVETDSNLSQVNTSTDEDDRSVSMTTSSLDEQRAEYKQEVLDDEIALLRIRLHIDKATEQGVRDFGAELLKDLYQIVIDSINTRRLIAGKIVDDTLLKSLSGIFSKFDGTPISENKALLIRDLSSILFDEVIFNRVVNQIQRSYEKDIQDLQTTQEDIAQELQELEDQRDEDIRILQSDRHKRLQDVVVQCAPTSPNRKGPTPPALSVNVMATITTSQNPSPAKKSPSKTPSGNPHDFAQDAPTPSLRLSGGFSSLLSPNPRILDSPTKAAKEISPTGLRDRTERSYEPETYINQSPKSPKDGKPPLSPSTRMRK